MPGKTATFQSSQKKLVRKGGRGAKQQEPDNERVNTQEKVYEWYRKGIKKESLCKPGST